MLPAELSFLSPNSLHIVLNVPPLKKGGASLLLTHVSFKKESKQG
jgi:hypothetical protein